MTTKHTNTYHDTYLPAVVFQVTSFIQNLFLPSYTSKI